MMTFQYNEHITLPNDIPNCKELLGVWSNQVTGESDLVAWKSLMGGVLVWYLCESSEIIEGWYANRDILGIIAAVRPDIYDPAVNLKVNVSMGISVCQCNAQDLLWFGHDTQCLEYKEIKRSSYSCL